MSFIVIAKDLQTSKLTYFGPFDNRSDAVKSAKNYCTVKSFGKGCADLKFDENAGTCTVTYHTKGYLRNTYFTFEAVVQSLIDPKTVEEEIKKQEEAALKTQTQTEEKKEEPKVEEKKEEPKHEEKKEEPAKGQDPVEGLLTSTTQDVAKVSTANAN